MACIHGSIPSSRREHGRSGRLQVTTISTRLEGVRWQIGRKLFDVSDSDAAQSLPPRCGVPMVPMLGDA